MHYEDIPVFEELLQDEDICEFDLAYPMIVVKVEPILHTSDNAIEITYYVGFTNRDEKVVIESEKYFGDRNHIKAYVDRYVTSHYLKKPETFEWHMKKLLHHIMMSRLPQFDPEIKGRVVSSYDSDFSDPEKADLLRDFWDEY
jgi:hypothetical protein